jgi:hypothetical protein
MQVDPMLELLPDATVHHIGTFVVNPFDQCFSHLLGCGKSDSPHSDTTIFRDVPKQGSNIASAVLQQTPKRT